MKRIISIIALCACALSININAHAADKAKGKVQKAYGDAKEAVK